MLEYDRVILYNSKTRGFCEGPLLGLEIEGISYGAHTRLNVETYVENAFDDEEEVMHVTTEYQKKLNDVKKELREVEYQLRLKQEEFEKYQPQKCGSEKQVFNWRWE